MPLLLLVILSFQNCTPESTLNTKITGLSSLTGGNGGGYEGKLQRRQGLPLDVKVVSADAEKLVVDLMFGPNDLPWADVSPAWMMTTAREAWLSGNPDESNTPDMVVRRSDGSYVFHFVNVVDDLEM